MALPGDRDPGGWCQAMSRTQSPTRGTGNGVRTMDIVTDGPTLTLSGDFDVRSTMEVRTAIYEASHAYEQDVVVDLTGVDDDRPHRRAGAGLRHARGQPHRPPPPPARLRAGRPPDAAPDPPGPRGRGRAGRRQRLRLCSHAADLRRCRPYPRSHDREGPSLGDADVRRPLDRRGVQRAVPDQPGQGPDRSLGGLRPADPDRLRPRRRR